MPDKPTRRIRFKVDYPELDVVGLVTGEGSADVERGYLVADEDGVLRFVPEFDREPKSAER
jgi:hypothetical protein